MTKQLTKEKIETVNRIYGELDQLNRDASDTINRVREGAKDRKMSIERKGKEIEVAESDLWDEVYWQAPTNAREILTELYPEAFEKSKLANEKTKELTEYCLVELGYDPENMKLSSLISLVDAMVELKFAERDAQEKADRANGDNG